MKRNKQQSGKNAHHFPAEIAGWYGMGAIIGAYALVSFGAVDADSVAYQMLNLTGAAGLLWISAVKRVGQTVVLNLFWITIAVIALLNMLL